MPMHWWCGARRRNIIAAINVRTARLYRVGRKNNDPTEPETKPRRPALPTRKKNENN